MTNTTIQKIRAGEPFTITTLWGEEQTIVLSGKHPDGTPWSDEFWPYIIRMNEADLLSAKNSHEYVAGSKYIYMPTQDGVANKDNFMWETVAVFRARTTRPHRKPDHISYTRGGKVSSEYWYTRNGVVRGSSHWGVSVGSCDWAITSIYGFADDVTKTQKIYGYAAWTEFVQKTERVVVDGSVIAKTTFTNTIGKGVCQIDGKTYDKTPWGWMEVEPWAPDTTQL